MRTVARRVGRVLAASVALTSVGLLVLNPIALLHTTAGTQTVDQGEQAAYGRLGPLVLPVLAGLPWLRYDALRAPSVTRERGSGR